MNENIGYLLGRLIFGLLMLGVLWLMTGALLRWAARIFADMFFARLDLRDKRRDIAAHDRAVKERAARATKA